MMIFSDVIINIKIWVSDTDPGQLKECLSSCLKTSDHITLQFMEHFFEPEGYTAIWLLAESHLAVHTFPERRGSYIELSSCSPSKVESFVADIQKYQLSILEILKG